MRFSETYCDLYYLNYRTITKLAVQPLRTGPVTTQLKDSHDRRTAAAA
jgi:hypothetical protein